MVFMSLFLLRLAMKYLSLPVVRLKKSSIKLLLCSLSFVEAREAKGV